MESRRKNPEKKHNSSYLLLQKAGLRPTRQRLALADLLFDGAHKHVTAEQTFAATRKKRLRLSLATVYNTLNHFLAAGLMTQVAVDGGQVYFDTHTGPHHHIYNEESGDLTDIPASAVRIARFPKLPKGKKLSRVDVMLRVRNSA